MSYLIVVQDANPTQTDSAFSISVLSVRCRLCAQFSFFLNHSATHVKLKSTGTSTRGPIVAASA